MTLPIPRKWEVWHKPGFSDTYAQRWGYPLLPSVTWEKGQLWRTRRAAELIVGTTVLDVGCGCGHLYALLRDKVDRRDYLGVDNSVEMIGFCRRSYPNAWFHTADVYDLRYMGSGYRIPVMDTVYCLSVLLHLPDPLGKPLEELWGKAGRALVFNCMVDDENPRVEHMEDGLLYNVMAEAQVLAAAHSLPDVKRVEAWISDVYGDPKGKREFLYVRAWK